MKREPAGGTLTNAQGKQIRHDVPLQCGLPMEGGAVVLVAVNGVKPHRDRVRELIEALANWTQLLLADLGRLCSRWTSNSVRRLIGLAPAFGVTIRRRAAVRLRAR